MHSATFTAAKGRLSKLAATLAALALAGQAAAMSLDDFVPPSEGGAIAPQGAVSEEDRIVQAATMQDGLGYAYQQILDEEGEGVRTVQTKTGMGTIAVSIAGYQRYENINATLLSKRAAYLRAYTDAQAQLVRNFEGFQNQCRTAVSNLTVALDSGVEGVANSASSVEERCREVTRDTLAAFVTYMIKDDVDNNEITVALASSTKTRDAVSRVGGAVVVSADPKKAFEHIAREISQGVVPPVGAKLIHNPENGEAIVIGFGSAIIRQNADSAVARNLRKMASRQAQLRANNALVAFLKGSQVYWEGGFEEGQIEASEQFEIPTNNRGELGDPVAYDQTRHTFLNAVAQSDDYQVITQGQLPPGIKLKTFPSEDGYWMNTIAVYMPSAIAEATQAGRENRAAASRQSGGQSGGRAMRIEGGLAPGSTNPQGPSGKVVHGNDF